MLATINRLKIKNSFERIFLLLLKRIYIGLYESISTFFSIYVLPEHHLLSTIRFQFNKMAGEKRNALAAFQLRSLQQRKKSPISPLAQGQFAKPCAFRIGLGSYVF
jgi:hypothetical protein